MQQIGVKFYDEFLVGIPRGEVEGIAETVRKHARKAAGVEEGEETKERDVVCVVVGGYRRGKEESGDVDVILSHREEKVTKNLVVDVVRSLEEEGWITHTLTLQTTTSDRDQQTLPFNTKGHQPFHGGGFDSLDKALCVWQDPTYSSHDANGEENKKNPNIHRRVDIILSPWRTVGCAILGWSGGTTFQRDIRRFASHERGWKFDSSGVRERGGGVVVDLENPKERYFVDKEGVKKERQEWEWKDDWKDRERRVMEGLGIGWRDAPDRCTG